MNKVFVGSLPFAATDEEIFEFFSQLEGVVVSKAENVRDRETGRSRGFGFVTFETPEMAEMAVTEFNGKDFMGRPLVVNIAKPREDRPPRRDFAPRGNSRY